MDLLYSYIKANLKASLTETASSLFNSSTRPFWGSSFGQSLKYHLNSQNFRYFKTQREKNPSIVRLSFNGLYNQSKGENNKPFPSSLVPSSLVFQNESKCETFHMKMDHANQGHFHNNGFALRLAVKQRRKGTRKWPICRLLYK